MSALDGSGVRRIDAQEGQFGWAFDGTRLAWVAQPCAQPQIQVWDLAGPPPAPVPDRCVRARLASPSLKLNRAGTRFKVRLTCPPSPARGCAGSVSADVYAAGRKLVEAYSGEYRIPAGANRTQTLRIDRHNRLRGAGKLIARVKVGTSNGNDKATRLRLDR